MENENFSFFSLFRPPHFTHSLKSIFSCLVVANLCVIRTLGMNPTRKLNLENLEYNRS